MTTHSAHYVAHAGLRRAISDYLARERDDVEHMNEILSEAQPVPSRRAASGGLTPSALPGYAKDETIRRDKMTSAAYDTNNIFAKILRGEIPSVKIYEDEHTLAFMDVIPRAGHVLVVPRAASRNLLDADPAVLAKTIPVVQTIANAVKEAFDADGVFVCQFNEPAAGQTVFCTSTSSRATRHRATHFRPRWKMAPCHNCECGEDQSGALIDDEAVRASAEPLSADARRRPQGHEQSRRPPVRQ